ncbi:Pectinesterase inhibitor domain [Arabidopsis suecica]|uniref:Pectinesterase inhibitor domain n=2 Tax=Arabidopsis TaxID=3701 RepID=A0A8T2BCW6_ARASU|nr:Pectinesterase inhibitor domain [Arabidopsis suecica]
MAFSCVIRNVFSILPLLVILLITPLSSSYSINDKITKELINQLCSQPTIYNHFCVAWVTSVAKTFNLDLQGLVYLLYQKTELLGSKNLEMIKDLERTETDPKLKIPYGSCVKEYELSNRAIEEAKEFASANSKAYLSASKAASRAFDSISMCEAYLEGLKMPDHVSTRNLWFERMCNIDKIFSDLLI